MRRCSARVMAMVLVLSGAAPAGPTMHEGLIEEVRDSSETKTFAPQSPRHGQTMTRAVTDEVSQENPPSMDTSGIEYSLPEAGHDCSKASEQIAVLDSREGFDSSTTHEHFPIALGYQLHYTSVSSGADRARYLIRTAGLAFFGTVCRYLIVGVRDVMLYVTRTIEGNRGALTVSPFLGAYLLAVPRMGLEGAFGIMVQGQSGVSGGSDVAMAPFVSLLIELWPVKRVSVGPVTRLCYVSKGNVYTRAIPADRSHVLPQGTLWLDAGLAMSVRF